MASLRQSKPPGKFDLPRHFTSTSRGFQLDLLPSGKLLAITVRVKESLRFGILGLFESLEVLISNGYLLLVQSAGVINVVQKLFLAVLELLASLPPLDGKLLDLRLFYETSDLVVDPLEGAVSDVNS